MDVTRKSHTEIRIPVKELVMKLLNEKSSTSVPMPFEVTGIITIESPTTSQSMACSKDDGLVIRFDFDSQAL